MDAAAKAREALHHAPTESFTVKRGETKMIEDVKLIKHFAPWLTELTGYPVNADTFCEDLMDGQALCKVLTLLKGSEVTTYHEKGSGLAQLDAFKSRENLVQFHEGCKKLALPVQFGTEELEMGNLGKVASCLVFVAHTCATQGVGIKQMDQTLRSRLESVAGLTDNIEGGGDLTWWQNLLVKLGFGDYIESIGLEQLKAYIAQAKENGVIKLEEVKAKLNAVKPGSA